ncbi:hypothetical protein F4810DRAFT_45260 [Camillea tinctor]|nr:hypothetical protein F4810DRAFT_45260 [Camillea tinctor]
MAIADSQYYSATTLSHSKKTLAAESDNKSQTKKVAVPQYGPASHLFASPFDYARDSDKKIASPSPYRNFGSPSPQATVMAKEETQPIRDQSRIDIPKYGPASHLFVSRFSQSLDIGEKSATTSTTTAESTSAKTATSNKRQHVDYEEEDELYETEPEKYDSDSSDGGYHYGPRTPKRRRRNKNNSSRWARRF